MPGSTHSVVTAAQAQSVGRKVLQAQHGLQKLHDLIFDELYEHDSRAARQYIALRLVAELSHWLDTQIDENEVIECLDVE